jgi:beta-lactamase class A
MRIMNDQLSRRGLLVGAAALVCGGRAALAAVEGPVVSSEGRAVGSGAGASAQRTAPAAVEAGAAHGTMQAAAASGGAPAGAEAAQADGGKHAHSGGDAAAKRYANGDAAKRLAALEKREGGRLGVEAWDTGTDRRIQHRNDERFGMCSVFKFLAAGAILKRVDEGTEHLDRRIEFGAGDLMEYAPVAKEHVKEGALTLGEACAAAVQWSDNTAANMMLKVLGGPAAVTAFIRSTGDQVTRLDNIEPALNVVLQGEVHDTTTAASMVGLLNSVVLGKVLSAESRARLEGWMLDAKVGEHRLPAGVPEGWRIAHKTGTWDDQANDVGIIWPPNRSPIIVAALYYRKGTRQKQRENVLAEVARIVTASL